MYFADPNIRFRNLKAFKRFREEAKKLTVNRENMKKQEARFEWNTKQIRGEGI